MNYYYDANSEADYEAIAAGSNWNGGRLETQLTSGANQLYNGNINSMVTSVTPFMEGGPMATVYRYDQLNRIKGMKTYRNFNQSTNVWNSGGTSNLFATSYSYDANGNILSLSRNSGDVSKLGMDALTYHYKAGTNQLEYVDDGVSAGEHENDVDDQEEDNYVYDAIGNLVHDEAEGIETIEWNVYGKVRRIVRSSTATDKPDLEFRYDAGGQRVAKIVKDGANEVDWKYQYYVRDAQGNVMATYDKKSVVSGDTSVYRKINEWLVTDPSTSSGQGSVANFGEFVDGQLHTGGQFDGAFIEAIIEWNEFSNVMGGYTAGDLLGWDGNLVSYILQNFEANSTGPEQDELWDLVWNNNHSDFIAQLSSTCSLTLQEVLEKILVADGLNNYLLNGLYTQNTMDFNNMFTSLYTGIPPGPTTQAGKISWLRDPLNGISTSTLANAIETNFGNPMDIDAVLVLLSQSLIEGSFSFGELIDFMECMDPIALSSTLVNNFSNQALLLQLILDNANQESILSLVMTHDPDFVKDVAENYSYLVSEAVRKLETMSVDAYLALVRDHYGDEVLGDLLAALSEDLQFAQKFVLNEHHLYGSSRLGVKTHKRVLLRKEFSIAGFEETGEYIIDETLDSFVYESSNNYFCRTLGFKQYEMVNHLGNVLATVLDRKTGVFDSGADTLMYYTADVVNATLYYPFGLEMTKYSNPDFNYSYDFNGKETDSETGLQDYGERIYNKSYGKFLSPDRLIIKEKLYPWYSPYHFAGNKPIHCIDLDGLEEYCVVSWYNTELNRGFTIIKLIKVDGPLTVKYYKREWGEGGQPADNWLLTEEGYTDSYQGESTVSNPWRNEREKTRAESLLNTNATTAGFSDPNDPTILPIPTPPPPIIPFNGRIIRRGESTTISKHTIGWVSTSPITGGSDPTAKSGTLTKEGKKILDKLAASINSMEDVNSVTINSNYTVGTGVTDSEFNYAENANKQVNKAAVDYLKSKLTNRDISVTGNATTNKSDTNRNTSTTVKVQ